MVDTQFRCLIGMAVLVVRIKCWADFWFSSPISSQSSLPFSIPFSQKESEGTFCLSIRV